MKREATELAQRLAGSAEAVCRVLSLNGRRHGRYWLVRDTQGRKGRSLYVRLAGKDAADGRMPRPLRTAICLILIRLNQAISVYATPWWRRGGPERLLQPR